MSASTPKTATPESDDRDAPNQGLRPIADVSTAYGLTFRALRFYEARGLISPTRIGMTRLYSPKDCDRLELILKGKRMGFTLTEIRAMIDQSERRGAASGLAVTAEKIAAQIAELEARRAEIDAAIAELRAQMDGIGG